MQTKERWTPQGNDSNWLLTSKLSNFLLISSRSHFSLIPTSRKLNYNSGKMSPPPFQIYSQSLLVSRSYLFEMEEMKVSADGMEKLYVNHLIKLADEAESLFTNPFFLTSSASDSSAG